MLKAVYSDIQVPEPVARCHALGLINKVITGPLWRVLESADVTILLEMNKYFNKLMTKLDIWSQDAGVLLQGDVELESDYPPRKDEILHHLIIPTEYDATTQEILEILCHAFFCTAFSISSDHLPGRAYYNSTVRISNETKSVSKTNSVSQRHFGKLDRLLQEKPNANTLSLEAMVLFSSNKTING